jgi:putative endonuclease
VQRLCSPHHVHASQTSRTAEWQREPPTSIARKFRARSLTRLKYAGFTSRYNLTRLAYYESFAYPDATIDREKEIKGWRSKKIRLIESMNPHSCAGFRNDGL